MKKETTYTLTCSQCRHLVSYTKKTTRQLYTTVRGKAVPFHRVLNCPHCKALAYAPIKKET